MTNRAFPLVALALCGAGDAGVCPGNAPGRGQTSYFFGLASTDPAVPVVSTVRFSDGTSVSVDARSPG
jgi:hypothetical protein